MKLKLGSSRELLLAAPGAAFLIAGMGSVIPASAVAKPASISGSPEFLREIAAVRADSHNYDKFKEPLRSALDGQHFKITLPFDTDSSRSARRATITRQAISYSASRPTNPRRCFDRAAEVSKSCSLPKTRAA